MGWVVRWGGFKPPPPLWWTFFAQEHNKITPPGLEPIPLHLESCALTTRLLRLAHNFRNSIPIGYLCFLYFSLMAFFLLYLQGVKRGFFRKRKGSRLLRKLKKKACKKVCKWAIKRICRRVPDGFNKLWRKCLNLRNRGCKRVCRWLIG